MTKMFRLFSLIFLLCAVPAAAASKAHSGESYQHYLKALLLESQGSFDAAHEELQKALAIAPDSAYLQRTAAELLLRLNQIDKAAVAIDRANALDPSDYKALILAGQIYWSLGDTEKAERKLRAAVALDPDGTEAIMNLAGALTPKDPRRAIQLYEDFLARHPNEVEIREQVAQLHQGQGNIEKAREQWEKTLEWSPDSLRAHLALAQIAEVHYDTSTAISHYEAVLAEDPGNLPLLLRIGELRYRNNEMAKASEAFSRAQALAPGSAAANFWLALLAEHRGDYQEAIRLLQQVEAKTHDPGVALRLSYYYSQVGRYKDAIKLLRNLSESEPSNPDFVNYLAIALEEDEQWAAAEKALQRLIALSPSDPEAYFHIATVYDRMKDFPKAEKALRQALALRPDYHVALNYLGYSYADRGIKLDEAEQLVNDAIAIDPNNGAYLDSMGWTYYKQGKLQKAEDFLREATFRAKDALIWDHLGQVLNSQGDIEGAILAWDESLRIDPTVSDVPSKVKKAVGRLSQRGRLNLYLKRAIANFGDLRAIKSVVQVSVCRKGPCFESRAQFSYDRATELRAEIPGPLAGPLMALSKPVGRPATYGAIHPALQDVEFYVTRAFERIADVLTADAFREADLSEMSATVAKKGRALSGRSGAMTIRFRAADGTVRDLEWASPDAEEALKLDPYGTARAGVLPLKFEWIDKRTKFRLKLQFLGPSVMLTPAQSEQSE